MNREILFKAKRVDNGEWVEGYYTYYPEGFDGTDDTKHILRDTRTNPGTIYFVNPITICQYTGLTDKNGKKIWENDICDRKEKYPEIVKYYDGDWTLDYSYASGDKCGSNYCNLGFYVRNRGNVEVIGNIFDNLELLEGGTK